MQIRFLLPRLLLIAGVGFVCTLLLLGPPNKPIPGIAVHFLGVTNTPAGTKLLVEFPAILVKPPKVSFGQKWRYQLKLYLDCLRADGTSTNFLWHASGGNGPHHSSTYHVMVPPNTAEVRFIKAEGLLGSYEDVQLPIRLKSIKQWFAYKVPEGTFPLAQ
jgi:hypothetical protein